MRTIHLTIPDEIELQLRAVASNTEEFIITILKKNLSRMAMDENKKMEKLLIQGYKHSKKETKQMQQDFAKIDLENWDEY